MRLERPTKLAFRHVLFSVLAAAALGASGCGRQAPAGGEGELSTGDAAERQRVQAEQQLASLGGPANAQTRALYQGEFTASGALEGLGGGEGAWELRLLEDYAQFERPGLGEDGGLAGERDYREQGLRVSAGPLIITIRAENCPLPSGEALPYSASVLFEGVSYQGCAQRGVALADRPTWAAVLSELLPAIDVCLRRVNGRSVRVTTASLLGEDQVGVRLRQGDGGRFGCVATLNGSRVVAFDPLLDSDHLYGESDPEFIRAPGNPPPAGECRTIQEVSAGAPVVLEPHASEQSPAIEQGQPAVVGWLVRRTC
ncbi:MAG: hypothetical protein JNJ73_01220 [Hyphomonadaceae bacterium]|nr:hypothetical protein [Hyphomonadaceae bacterium]